MNKESQKKQSQKEEEYVELGKKLQAFYESGYIHKKQALSWAFLKGMAGGLGAFLGGTLVIAILLWTLNQFDQVPLLGPLLETLRTTLDS